MQFHRQVHILIFHTSADFISYKEGRIEGIIQFISMSRHRRMETVYAIYVHAR